MSLLDDLISYWKLNEASGNALDAHGSNDLTENGGSIGTAAGKVGNARDFEASNSQYFSHADNAELSTGEVDFTFAFWIKPESTGGFGVIAMKGWPDLPGQAEFLIFDDGSRGLEFRVVDTSGEQTTISTGVALSAGEWNFIVCWQDVSNNEIAISVNDDTPEIRSRAFAGSTRNGNAAFTLGASPSQSLFWDGLIDEFGFWKRVLTSDERTELYNSGNGSTYPFTRFIASPSVSPIVLAGVSTDITWTSSGGIADVDILLSTDGGSTYPVTIASGVTNTGSYDWTPLQAQVTATAKLKVRSSADAMVFAVSTQFVIATTTAGGGGLGRIRRLQIIQ